MRICFIPIDNRPVCYNLIKDIIAIDGNIRLYIPPREYLGSLTKKADVDKIYEWFEDIPNVDKIIISLDTIAYGGLIPSRRSNDSFEIIKQRMEKFRDEWIQKNAEIYAFSSIMRISNNNYNIEEKEYWKDYGEQIFQYSYFSHENELNNNKSEIETDIPQAILDDYLKTRKRNFEINKMYLNWEKQGYFKTLVFSKDDCAEFGFNVKEAKELEKNGAQVITGADEIPLSLLANSFDIPFSVNPIFLENNSKHLISNYEDVSIEKSVLNQLKLAKVDIEKKADVNLIINNFKKNQGEIVMKKNTEQFSGFFEFPETPYMFADVRNSNGADNNFVDYILPKINLELFYGYSAWNTSANTLGSLICAAKVKFASKIYKEKSFRKLQMIRFLDDWAYQANVRQQIKEPQNIQEKMRLYEERIAKVLKINIKNNYIYPWNRLFEIEVVNESD